MNEGLSQLELVFFTLCVMCMTAELWRVIVYVIVYVRYKARLSLRLNGHFPRGPGLASTRMSPFWISVKQDDWGGGDNRCAKLQPNRHHQQTNTQFFTRRMSFLSPNQRCQSTEGNLTACSVLSSISLSLSLSLSLSVSVFFSVWYIQFTFVRQDGYVSAFVGSSVIFSRQCFDTVGWATGRASSL